MDILGFFLLQHKDVHSKEVASGLSYANRIFDGLTNEQMRTRPGQELNSLVWILWHMARTEDVAVNLVITNGQQVLDDAWLHRLNIPLRHIGTGMTDDEVSELSIQADIIAVNEYRNAVGFRTQQVVSSMEANIWDDIIGFNDTIRAVKVDAFRIGTGWDDAKGYQAWQGHSRSVQLAGSALRHNAIHLGEAITVRSQGGFGLGI